MNAVPIAHDPVPNLTARMGDDIAVVRKLVDRLTLGLRALDDTRDQLKAQSIIVDIDLGPIGNAAAAARRDLERESGKPSFSFPKPRPPLPPVPKEPGRRI